MYAHILAYLPISIQFGMHFHMSIGTYTSMFSCIHIPIYMHACDAVVFGVPISHIHVYSVLQWVVGPFRDARRCMRRYMHEKVCMCAGNCLDQAVC